MSKDLSRRDFLKGAAASAVGAAALGLGGCSKSPSTDSTDNTDSEVLSAENYPNKKWKFEVMPKEYPIPDSKIKKTYTADVIIIGSGPSGLVTAVACQENGVDALLFSASSKPVGRGGSNHGFGTKYQEAMGVDYTKDSTAGQHAFRNEQYAASLMIDQKKWARWVNNSAESMNWLIDKMESKGYKTMLEEGMPDPDGFLNVPPASHSFYTDDKPIGPVYGAKFQSKVFADIFKEKGGTIHFNTKALYLIRENKNTGRVSGVVAQKKDGTYVRYAAKKAVVMATGDFSRDPDMMAKYSPSAWDTFKDTLDVKNIDYDTEDSFTGIYTGDGQKMGLWVGAAWQHMSAPPMINAAALGPRFHYAANFWGINLDRNGKRFMNEITNFAYAATSVMQNPGKTAFYVWDSDYANRSGEWMDWGHAYKKVNGVKSRTPQEEVAKWENNVKGGNWFKADTIEQLVDQFKGIDKKAALESIRKYNEYAKNGYDAEFHVNPAYLFPIMKPPFYGAKGMPSGNFNLSVPCFLTVCGGLRTNDYNQVCDADDKPIPGLYNVGIMTGDFYANTYNFVLFGQNLGACCCTLPWLLAKDLAAL